MPMTVLLHESFKGKFGISLCDCKMKKVCNIKSVLNDRDREKQGRVIV